MNFWKSIFFIGLIGILTTSCIFSDDFREDADAYKVNVTALNVRQYYSTDARILGKLKMGDTVYTKESYKNWRRILYHGRMAFVDSTYLTKLVIEKYKGFIINEMNPTAIGIIKILDKYGNWKTWMFWIIAAVMWFTSSYLFKFGNRLLRGDDAVDYWVEHGYMGMNFLPYVAILVGFLFGIVYFFWTEDVQRAIFIDPFWWLPVGKGFLYWYLWFLGLISVVSILVFSIYDLLAFRNFSVLRIAYFLFSSSFIFVCMIFLASASIIILLVLLAIDFLIAVFF